MHRQSAQKIVERRVYACVNFLHPALAKALGAEQFLLPLEGQPVKVGTPQRNNDLNSLTERTGAVVRLIGMGEQPFDALVKELPVGCVEQSP